MFLSSGRLGTLSNIRVPGASSGGKTSRVNGPILPLGVEEVSRVALALYGLHIIKLRPLNFYKLNRALLSCVLASSYVA